jgi:5'-deoxynucleotidase YfbR-like HD superfamily hydrolase
MIETAESLMQKLSIPRESSPILYNLFTLKRRGWLLRGVPDDICESVEDHSRHVMQAAYFLTRDPDLATMMYIHDWPESLCGDPTPRDKVDPILKHNREYEAMKNIISCMPDGKRYLDMWLEFEALQTPNAIIGKQLDRLDAGVKALHYEQLGFADVIEFYPDIQKKLKDERLVKIFSALMDDRAKGRDFISEDPHLVYFGYLSESRHSGRQ